MAVGALQPFIRADEIAEFLFGDRKYVARRSVLLNWIAGREGRASAASTE
jgi:hypothetical protein